MKYSSSIDNSIEEIIKTKSYNFNEEFNEKDKFEKIAAEYNFIPDGFEQKLCMLKKYIELGIPVLIEGPTGSSKTLSSEIVCKYLEREICSINLSSDTTIGDLMGKLIGNTNTKSKISFSDGPFKDAFIKGKCLRLDEINLASESILQCMKLILLLNQFFNVLNNL